MRQNVKCIPTDRVDDGQPVDLVFDQRIYSIEYAEMHKINRPRESQYYRSDPSNAKRTSEESGAVPLRAALADFQEDVP